MQNYVFLLNTDKTCLDLIHPARARELQFLGKASMFRQFPYTLILHHQVLNPQTKEYSIKIDPGSKWSGFAIQCGDEILFRMELKHRGSLISSGLQKRAGFRKGRRGRNLRYRAKRFNRQKPEGWLAPSLKHRLLTIQTWIKKFMCYCPVTAIEIEQVRFDMQKIVNPEINGTEYQQGSLLGYEVREYLLEKWERESVKCWSGGRTKFNRCSQGLEKSHSIDAACVGESGASIKLRTNQPLIVACTGHGNRQARRVNASGFPAVAKAKAVFTHVKAGDIVKVLLSKDRKNVLAGTYTARVKTPTIKGCEVLITGNRVTVSTMKNVTFIHRNDGYSYGW